MDRVRFRKDTLEALGRYQRAGGLTLTPETLSAAMSEESDRGMVVIIGSLTEDLLVDNILKKFPNVTDQLRKDLTRPGGALGSWAQQINVAIALGIIDEEDAEHLEVLKTMRNACAHSRQHIDFNTPELKNALSLMLPEEGAKTVLASEKPIFQRLILSVVSNYLWWRIKGAAKNEAMASAQFILDDAMEYVKRLALRQKRKPRRSKGGGAAPKNKGRRSPQKSSPA